MQESIWASILIVCGIFILIMVDWIVEEYRKFKARQKKKASKPIDYISFMYDCEGRVKQDRAELAELMKRGGKRDGV